MTLAAGLEPTLDLDGLAAGVVYLLVIGFVFIESGILVGFFLPGDSILFAAGLLAAKPGTGVDVVPMAVGVTIAAVAGDAVGYYSGRRLGRPWLERKPTMARHVERAEAFYERWGPLAVIIARWFPWLRTATPVLAGVARMPYRRFFLANVIGALTWGTGLVLLGYYAYEIEWLRTAAISVGIGSAVVFVGFATVRALRGRSRRRSDRVEETAQDPAAR